MHDIEKIHFGTLGLKTGDTITFIPTGEEIRVASGQGTPDNGGTLVRFPDNRDDVSYSIRAMTRKLTGDKFNEAADVWRLWHYQGEDLRTRHTRITPESS